MNRDGIIRAGVVGTGFVAIPQTDNIRKAPGIELAAVCSPAPERLKEIKKTYGIGRGYTDWRDMAADKDIQVIHNCTPNHLHGKINRATILTGKHIYVEKPLSPDAAEAESLWQLAMERDVAHGVNHQYRLSGAVQEVRARVMEGEGGRPLYVGGCYLQDSAAHHAGYTSRQMPETSSTRALADIGAHWADTAICVMGQPIQAVYAQVYTRYLLRLSTATEREVEINSGDTTFVMVQFEGGTPGAAVFSGCAVGYKNDLVVTVSGEQREYTQRQQSGNRFYIGNREQGSEELLTGSNLVHGTILLYVTMPTRRAMDQPDILMHTIESFYQSIRTGQYLTGQVLMPFSMTVGGAMPSSKPA